MSFLNTNYSAQVAARLTKKGRNAIASGNFVISYFAIGDSEYNYRSNATQGVIAPLDKDNNVKYPIYYTSGTTIYGIPVTSTSSVPCSNTMIGTTDWTMNTVWETKPIGLQGSDRSLDNYVSNKYIGIKNLLGYTTSSGQTSNTGTTIVDTTGSLITITPEEQKTIAIIHFSNHGTSQIPDLFFKYDDYINPDMTFEIDFSTLYYHRGGTSFYMGGTDKQVVSKYNPNSIIHYRDLLDGSDNRVGKVFYNQKLIVFDDEELVAVLDPNSKRNYTLPAPKVGVDLNTSLSNFGLGKTVWVTYMLANTNNSSTNGLPCNYFMKATGISSSQGATVTFDGNGELNALNVHFTANKFYILYQVTNSGSYPTSNGWYIADYTTEAGGSTFGNLKAGKTFYINDNKSWSSFNLTNYLTGTDYSSNSGAYFGDQHLFPGTVQVTRTTDIQEMNFVINLPTDKFNTSQNPTNTGQSPMITEVALLDSNKNALVMGKLAEPQAKNGTSVLHVKIDF